MKIQTEYQVWKMAAQDEARPILHGVRFELDPEAEPITYQEQQANGTSVTRTSTDRHGRALATDGFGLVVIPCIIEVGDMVPVVVELSAIEQLRKLDKLGKRDYEWRVQLDGAGIIGRSGILIPADKAYIKGEWPENFWAFAHAVSIPANYHELVGAGQPLAFNYDLMVAAQAALGTKHLRLTMRFYQGPFLLEPQNMKEGYPQGPYAVIMPMHYDSLSDYEKSAARFDAQAAKLIAQSKEPV